MDSRTKIKRSPKDMRKLLRKDVELTVNDRILTLAEYNYFFLTLTVFNKNFLTH